MDYIKLKRELKDLTKLTFLGCLEKLQKEDICGFGLYTDESVMSISISCNTIAYLKELQQEEEGYNEYFKWSMNEWKYEMINEAPFTDINKQLMLKFEELSEDENLFIKHKEVIFNISIEVLEELKKEQLFINLNEEFVLMVGVSELENKELEKYIVKRLNDKDKFIEFENWIDLEE